jgi:hypothetical protein
MRRGTIGATLGVAAQLAACAVHQAPVPLTGTVSDLEALVGQWVGEYSSTETGRRGSISFQLAARGDTAYGDVVMVPAGWNQPLLPMRDEPRNAGQRPRAEVLTISFVRVTGGEVSGTLAPYRDPTCDCALHTRFAGRLVGDVIDGTYTSRREQDPQEQRGRWRVTRPSPAR